MASSLDSTPPANALETLNDAQMEAVTTTEGYVRVVAGAGSGKTRALSHRFAYLVNDLGIMPGNILCVTFTNKAANEMRQRIHKLTGDNDTGYVNTFHGFCVSILQEDSAAISYPKSFLVLDNSDIDAMLKIIYEERGLTLRDKTFAKARDMFEIRKTITEPLYFFDQNEDIKLKWQKRLEYIMVDEFQDIDALQYRLMQTLAGYHKNLFVVGDPDQTIYTWRGASIKFLMDFDKDFSGTKTIVMNENYRSTPQITMVANSLIDANKVRIKKSLKSLNDPGSKVVVYHAKSQEDKAEWIAGSIEELVAHGTSYRDICLLYRAHYVTRSIEESFVKHKIPYTIFSGVQFFDRKEVKDALAYLRMIAFRDDLSFERIVNEPKRNIGERRMKFLRQFAAGQNISLYDALCRSLDNAIMKGTGAKKFVTLVEDYTRQAEQRSVSELLAAVLEASGYEEALRTEGSQERLDNLAELRQSVYEYETSCGEEATLDNYLKHVAMFSNLDTGFDANKVKLMTIHAAKGLEFTQVFLCALDEGVLPSRKTKTIDALEEERRLAFVAVTRAEKALYLSCADGATHEGIPRYPSRFIFDIDKDLLDFVTPLEDSLVRDAKTYIAYQDKLLDQHEAAPEFERGTRVEHPVFGKGTVKGVSTELKSYEILFDKMETTRSITFKAKLKRIEKGE